MATTTAAKARMSARTPMLISMVEGSESAEAGSPLVLFMV